MEMRDFTFLRQIFSPGTVMKFEWICLLTFAMSAAGIAAEPRLIGRVEIPSAVPDKSGEQGSLEGGIPANQWGGFGSGIAWLGTGNRYAVISDRGPADGATSYRCRFHIVDINVSPRGAIGIELLETRLLSNEGGLPLVGSLKALPDSGIPAARFDPEAIRPSGRGTFYISDEYGPSILEFNSNGRQIGQLPIPEKFLPLHPAADPNEELPPNNVRGRQPNRGIESIAISPDGNTITALMQGPLIQDGALDEMNKRIGVNLRMLEINRANKSTREFLYQLDQPTNACHEIEYLSPGKFLVIERDSKLGVGAAVKQIIEIDTREATDISQIASLPTKEIPAGVKPVARKLFIDLLDPRWKLAGESFPEKIEGIAFGPTLKDGSRLLLITSDNDFLPLPTFVYAFGVAP